jgi:hypothetical protein
VGAGGGVLNLAVSDTLNYAFFGDSFSSGSDYLKAAGMGALLGLLFGGVDEVLPKLFGSKSGGARADAAGGSNPKTTLEGTSRPATYQGEIPSFSGREHLAPTPGTEPLALPAAPERLGLPPAPERLLLSEGKPRPTRFVADEWGNVQDLATGRGNPNTIPRQGPFELGSGGVDLLDPNEVRYSQNSVNDVQELVNSFANKGFRGSPIDVVRLADRGLTAIDNTRILAGQLTDTPVEAMVHSSEELLPNEQFPQRFVPERGPLKGQVPRTYGEAVLYRISGQNKIFRTRYPSGSPQIGINEPIVIPER